MQTKRTKTAAEKKEELRFWIYLGLGNFCHYNDEHKVVVPLEDLVIRQRTDRYVCPVGGKKGVSLGMLNEIWRHVCRKGEKYVLWCKGCVRREEALWAAEKKALAKKLDEEAANGYYGYGSLPGQEIVVRGPDAEEIQ